VEIGQGIVDVGPADRAALEPILEESFEGWYLRHSMKTLHEIGTVRAALVEGKPAGLTMLKRLGEGVGYVYYLAVAREQRRKGLGSRLLDDALSYFSGTGLKVVYASVENEESATLFSSRGFRKTNFGEVSKTFGVLKAFSMYRSMLAVPGEVLLLRDLP
jgi:ribosomal protein S18 acetylase RimI-like enzyme